MLCKCLKLEGSAFGKWAFIASLGWWLGVLRRLGGRVGLLGSYHCLVLGVRPMYTESGEELSGETACAHRTSSKLEYYQTLSAARRLRIVTT
jgi:hypothetical protein